MVILLDDSAPCVVSASIARDGVAISTNAVSTRQVETYDAE